MCWLGCKVSPRTKLQSTHAPARCLFRGFLVIWYQQVFFRYVTQVSSLEYIYLICSFISRNLCKENLRGELEWTDCASTHSNHCWIQTIKGCTCLSHRLRSWACRVISGIYESIHAVWSVFSFRWNDREKNPACFHCINDKSGLQVMHHQHA